MLRPKPSRGDPSSSSAGSRSRLAEVRQPAEDVVEPLAVGPVRPELELRELAVPVTQPELPRRPAAASTARGRGSGARAATPGAPSGCRPASCSPSRTRRAAGPRTAGRRSRSPRETRSCGSAPAARVVDPEVDLRAAGGRVPRVDRAPGEDAPGSSLRAVADERLAARVDAQRDVPCVARDQLGRLRSGGQRERGEHGETERKAPHRPGDRQHRGKHRALA